MSAAKQLADALVSARIAYELPMIPVDDFNLTIDLMVDATWNLGFEGTMTDPIEIEGHEIHAVYWSKTNILPLLSTQQLERIQRRLDEDGDVEPADRG